MILNTGGPPAQKFEDITKEDCDKYHNQLFYSFFKILQEVKQFATNDLPNSYNYKKIAKQIAELNKTKAELTKQMEIQKKQGQISTAELTQTKINSIMMKINLLNKPYIEYQKKVVAEKKKNIEKQKKLKKLPRKNGLKDIENGNRQRKLNELSTFT